jgi:hypothetical protein
MFLPASLLKWTPRVANVLQSGSLAVSGVFIADDHDVLFTNMQI